MVCNFPAMACSSGRACSLSPVTSYRFRMFDKLTERLQGVIENLRGRGRLTEENISDTLRQVRMALLEADVALPVVKTFIESIRAKVLGHGDRQEPHARSVAGQDHS